MKKGKRLISTLLLFFFLSAILAAEIDYPWKETYIGALEGKEWTGLIIVPSPNTCFAFRIVLEKDDQVAEGADILYLISEVGPHSPDGQYSRLKVDCSLPFKQGRDTPILIKPARESETLEMEWSRQDEKTVIGRILAPPYVRLRLVHYFPWNRDGSYRSLPDGQVEGQSEELGLTHYLFWTSPQGERETVTEGGEVSLSFSMEKERSIHFVASIGEDARILSNHIYRYKNRKAIDTILQEEETRYVNKRVKVEGLYSGVAEAVTNNLFWTMLYQPGRHRLYVPAGRGWIFPNPFGGLDHWTIFEWDSFFSALEAAVESPWHAKDIVQAVLETQYPNGNIPNWRSHYGGTPDRSQPPVGSFVVLKLFGKTGDLDLLNKSYPYLKRWHSFWKERGSDGQPRRDGNGDGLLEWGSDMELVADRVPPWEEKASGKQRAMWESGQDDLPNWDEASFSQETGTLTMNCLDLNSLYALDAYCLAQIANILNIPRDYDFFLAEYDEMKELINRELWNEREGFYFDRHWNGNFSSRKAASNFYPLLARLPDEKMGLRMLRRLLNPKEFWGDYIIPTISRDDPAFKDQQYWRGTIWPPTNYLVYQGLKAYGFDAAAQEFAQKSSSLFLRSWNNFQLCPENFDSRTGEAGGQRYQSWGPLFPLIALEEYLDFTPWEGFRFGMLEPERKGSLSRLAIQGRHYKVYVARSKVILKEEEREILRTNGGAVFRRLLFSESEFSFEVKTLKKRRIIINFLKKGKYELWIDGQLKKIFKGKSHKIEIPEGDHTVLCLLLEEQD